MKWIIRISLVLVWIFLCTYSAYAETLLVGYDPETAYDGPECDWLDDATTISGGKWKNNRFTALASGNANLFKMRVPDTPTGCTSDDGCWALYEAGATDDDVGDLKVYGCWSGYDWTTIGVGVHEFEATVVVTDDDVTQGTDYWLVHWSQALDGTYYSSAGCSSQILAYRGRDEETCTSLGQLQTATTGEVGIEEVGYTSIPPPPAGSAYDTKVQTYRLQGVFDDGSVEDETPKLQGVAIITGGTIQ
jgi:hypothetical protein